MNHEIIFIIAEYGGGVLRCVNTRCFGGDSLLMLLTPSYNPCECFRILGVSRETNMKF